MASSVRCAETLRNIAAFLDGELEAPACAAIEAHCRTCGECAGLVRGLQHTVGLCRQAADAPLPPLVRRRARDAVRDLLHGRDDRDD